MMTSFQVYLERRESEGIQVLGARDLEDHLDLQVQLVKDGPAVRALQAVLVILELQEDRVINVHQGKLAHRDTVIRTPAWDTPLEAKMSELMFFY
ncbi:unnamed protein product [Tetraodon nigroviridis]|uniref:(spotted green pufferfish) hypothetical protein n=1 Tax=Tetraodon nigroviridis TaxID=99883 RepID=Q4SH64_TETNG|nr:unnamed protein product [Tetraodon nigroviridis]